MMKTTYLSILFFFMSLPILMAQDAEEVDTTKIWTTGGSLNATFSNVGLSNWAGGGQSSIALGAILNLNAKRTTEKSTWVNTAIFQFGMARVGEKDVNLFKKTDDNIILDSKYGYALHKHWSAVASLNFRTQMAPGYFYDRDAQGKERKGNLISKFLSPGYLLNAVGVQYQNEIFSVRYSPLATKLTFVADDSLSSVGAFGVDKGKHVRAEFGSNLDATLKYNFMKNVQLLSTLNLFANYERITQIDVNWENLISMKINKYLSTSFSTQLIYDHDVLIPQEGGIAKRAVQFKHVLNINFGYNF